MSRLSHLAIVSEQPSPERIPLRLVPASSAASPGLLSIEELALLRRLYPELRAHLPARSLSPAELLRSVDSPGLRRVMLEALSWLKNRSSSFAFDTESC